jgi:hypothetical protein
MRKVEIEIDDDGTVCGTGYIVNYKLTGEEAYTRLFPDPTSSPFTIYGLLDDSEYDLQVYRMCCDGQTSLASTTTFTTNL